MGARGPKKAPTPVKRARGTYRADRDAGVEVKAGEPPRPAWLSEPAAALWRELAPQLVRENLLTPLDGLVFALLCDTWSTFRACHEWIAGDCERMFTSARTVDKEGEEHEGSVYQHPIVSVWHKSRNDLLRLSREFGMTPSSRSGMRLGSNDDADDDPIAALSARFEQLVGAKRN
jgi:P27 family predicted phage terminase small subunit